MSTISRQVTPPEDPHANDELLTIAEVADVLRVPVATLRYWRHLGTDRTASASDAASATGAARSAPGCTARATAPPTHDSRSSPRLGRTRRVAMSRPGRSLPWKHQGKARDDVMKLRAIQKTSKALLEIMEHRGTDPREALEGQGHGNKH